MTDRMRVAGDTRPFPVLAASVTAFALAVALPGLAAGQERTPSFSGGRVSLEEAIAMAERSSENLAVARAGVSRAEGEQVRARADLFPQLSGSASYDRTLATEFSDIFGGSAGPPCDPFTLRPDAPVPDRVAEIERAIDCGAVGGSFFGGSGGDGEVDLPFGRKNIYRFNLALSQGLYTGGRVPAQRALARAGRQMAQEGLTSARAQVVLDVTEAYYDAALSDRLAAIAEAGLRQATATLEQVELSFRAGRLPEFEVLRARVARDNQRPLVARARAQRTLAYLRLRELLHAPPEVPLTVEADLDDPVLPAPAPFALPPDAETGARGSEAAPRVAVRQAEAGVTAREAALRIARSQRLPSLSFSSAYGRVAYAGLPSFSEFRTNWTVGVVAQVPILTGGRLRGGQMVAAADLAEARAQRDQARHLSEVDTQAVYEELDAARATWEASAGTVEQAARAYDIAALRYREGISTQLELSDARYLLEQAQANRAQAARDLQVARARIALLPDLPLGAGAPGAGQSTPGGNRQ
jgi:outer membrane protein TolC